MPLAPSKGILHVLMYFLNLAFFYGLQVDYISKNIKDAQMLKMRSFKEARQFPSYGCYD